jgi:hypothetical protein
MAKNTDNVGNKTGILPAGTTVWKKVDFTTPDNRGGRCILEMVVVEDGLVPGEAKATYNPNTVTMHSGRKCRVPLVYVKAVHNAPNQNPVPPGSTFIAIHDCSEYKVGELRRPDTYDRSKRQCAAGIHCFRTRKEAEAY